MNPLLLGLLKNAAPYLAAASLGFGAAWSVQSLRLTAAEQDFTAYQQRHTQLYLDNVAIAENQRKEAAHAYQTKQAELSTQIAAGDAYRRCVDAGKCGRLRLVAACPASDNLPPTSTADASSPDAIPTAREPAPAIVGDCAQTTLQLNELQRAIEAQPGY